MAPRHCNEGLTLAEWKRKAEALNCGASAMGSSCTEKDGNTFFTGCIINVFAASFIIVTKKVMQDHLFKFVQQEYLRILQYWGKQINCSKNVI